MSRISIRIHLLLWSGYYGFGDANVNAVFCDALVPDGWFKWRRWMSNR